MKMISTRTKIVGALAALTLMGAAPAAQAQDFFSNLFGGFGDAHVQRAPYASEYPGEERRVRRSYTPRVNSNTNSSSTSSNTGGGGSGQAYCVRTCDGRYFPISTSDNQSRAATCKSFCPASDTKVFYGSTIDTASDNGKPYSALPNAFKFRNELVAGCTCNGKDQIGLAPVKIENDPTLKRGDIVAGEQGLMVNRGPDRRGASLNMAPATQSVREKYERVPVLARE